MVARTNRCVVRGGLMLSLVLGMLLLCRSEARADDTIVKTTTTAKMLVVMRGEGYAVSIDDDGDILWKIDGLRTYMLVAEDGEAIQFYTVVTGTNATMAKVNAWNRGKRYSRSYLDGDGDPCLELDLDLAGGVTNDRILDFLRTCKLSFDAWQDEVLE